ncbi:hypothetical protein C2845_PM08G03610 [Panicum miliaceum]|uniref:Uncharacterized protein n=1 Tax=Panicum miliaceum TaxID=4540 RepID=A0A3L6R2C4_PANMI|nr:hypothetical protein C2845_PM08G03610 [Panicum miliaceum]
MCSTRTRLLRTLSVGVWQDSKEWRRPRASVEDTNGDGTLPPRLLISRVHLVKE